MHINLMNGAWSLNKIHFINKKSKLNQRFEVNRISKIFFYTKLTSESLK